MPRDRFIDTTIYRAAVRLYPPEFRRAFSAQLVGDFSEAREEVAAATRARRWAFRLDMLTDFIRTLPLQWWRSGWPAIAALAVAITSLAASALVSVWPRVMFPVPAGPAAADVLGTELVAVVVLFVILATLFITIGFAGPRPSRRRR